MSEHEHVESLADHELLRNVGQDCSQCFELLFHRYYRQVHSILVRVLRDRAEAEDILQEVFLSIYLQEKRLDFSRWSVRTWHLPFASLKAPLSRSDLSI